MRVARGRASTYTCAPPAIPVQGPPRRRGSRPPDPARRSPRAPTILRSASAPGWYARASGRPMDSKVLRPMSTGLAKVRALKCFRSSGRCHGIPLSRPITPFSVAATSSEISGPARDGHQISTDGVQDDGVAHRHAEKLGGRCRCDAAAAQTPRASDPASPAAAGPRRHAGR